MNTKIQTTRLTELLQRNLFLTPDLKQKILSSSSAKHLEVLPLLEKLDEKQTDLFKKVLLENPHFFGDLENMAIHEAIKKLIETEQKHRNSEISKAEAELSAKLKEL
jgi:hypothetical protein